MNSPTCARGHKRIKANIIITKKGHRLCLLCKRLRSSAWYWDNHEYAKKLCREKERRSYWKEKGVTNAR